MADYPKTEDSERLLESFKQELLGVVSHELKTPLMSIKEILSLLIDGALGPLPDNQKKYLSVAMADALRLEKTISDIISLTHSTAPLNRISVDIREIIAEVISIHSPIQITAPASLPPIFTNPEEALRFFNLLFSYATAHAAPGRMIPLTITVIGTSVTFTLRVTESTESAQSIKDQLSLHNNENMQWDRKTGTLGAELEICKKIMDRQKGYFSISPAPPSGFQVEWSLPVFTATHVYADMIDREITFSREHQLDFGLISVQSQMATEDALMKIQPVLLRKRDFAFGYSNETVIIAAEINPSTAPIVIGRLIKAIPLAAFSPAVFYPHDGTTAGELISKIIPVT